MAELAARGVRRIAIVPYFLYAGQHVTHDIPALLAECRQRFPQIAIEVLPTLENDPAIEDLVVERLAASLAPPVGAAIRPARKSSGAATRSSSGGLATKGQLDADARRIVRRIIHATADFSFARTLRLHPQAIERGRAALAEGKPVLCDVQMLRAGITKVRGEVLCHRSRGSGGHGLGASGTRAAAAMELFVPRLEGAIVAVGNAPTALWKLMEIVRAAARGRRWSSACRWGWSAPASRSLHCWKAICATSRTPARGGSPVAAAAVNALAS